MIAESKTIAGITHLPFSPVQTMTLGNGVSVSRSFDGLYRMTENRAAAVQDHRYTRDPAGNVTAINDTLDPGLNVALIYDDLYRLTFAEGTFGALRYAYDSTGNRQSITVDGLSETFQYTSGTNQLALIRRDVPIDIVTDSAGNIVQYGKRDFTPTISTPRARSAMLPALSSGQLTTPHSARPKSQLNQ